MTGRELSELLGRDEDWDQMPLYRQRHWDRLAVEVVPVSEVVEFVRASRQVDVSPRSLRLVANKIEARFAPGTGEDDDT